MKKYLIFSDGLAAVKVLLEIMEYKFTSIFKHFSSHISFVGYKQIHKKIKEQVWKLFDGKMSCQFGDYLFLKMYISILSRDFSDFLASLNSANLNKKKWLVTKRPINKPRTRV